jgi:prepilin-type N-terminal cleavage/methylation domain-containing protein
MKKLKGFTLIELLIVMGILVILIGTAIMISRWAIRRANTIDHKDSARNLEAALLSFKNENKFVPQVLTCNTDNAPTCYTDEFFRRAFDESSSAGDILSEYLDETPFDGGTDATYYYTSDSQGQYFIVCVSLGGEDDENEWGFYCTGTGIGFLPEGHPITREDIEPDNTAQIGIIRGDDVDDTDWCKDSMQFGGTCN